MYIYILFYTFAKSLFVDNRTRRGEENPAGSSWLYSHEKENPFVLSWDPP